MRFMFESQRITFTGIQLTTHRIMCNLLGLTEFTIILTDYRACDIKTIGTYRDHSPVASVSNQKRGTSGVVLLIRANWRRPAEWSNGGKPQIVPMTRHMIELSLGNLCIVTWRIIWRYVLT